MFSVLMSNDFRFVEHSISHIKLGCFHFIHHNNFLKGLKSSSDVIDSFSFSEVEISHLLMRKKVVKSFVNAANSSEDAIWILEEGFIDQNIYQHSFQSNSKLLYL
jgi:hypothetical protein